MLDRNSQVERMKERNRIKFSLKKELYQRHRTDDFAPISIEYSFRINQLETLGYIHRMSLFPFKEILPSLLDASIKRKSMVED